MEKLTNEKYWKKYWEGSGNKEKETFLFSDVVKDKIPELTENGQNMSYMEIGGAPGDIMVYFAQKYHCSVNCIDFVAKDVIEQRMQENHIENYTIIDEDFTQYHSEEKYDIVASYGFVEHFNNYKEIIMRHVKMAKTGGYIIISMPNIRKMNWLLYKLFNKISLAGVNVKAINLQKLQKQLEAAGCEIVEARYWLTNFFMFNNEYPLLRKHKVIRGIFCAIQKFMILIHIDNVPSSFFSPYMICIAKRKEEG